MHSSQRQFTGSVSSFKEVRRSHSAEENRNRIFEFSHRTHNDIYVLIRCLHESRTKNTFQSIAINLLHLTHILMHKLPTKMEKEREIHIVGDYIREDMHWLNEFKKLIYQVCMMDNDNVCSAKCSQRFP